MSPTTRHHARHHARLGLHVRANSSPHGVALFGRCACRCAAIAARRGVPPCARCCRSCCGPRQRRRRSCHGASRSCCAGRTWLACPLTCLRDSCIRRARLRFAARCRCTRRARRCRWLVPKVWRRQSQHEVRRYRSAAGRHRRRARLWLVAHQGAAAAAARAHGKKPLCGPSRCRLASHSPVPRAQRMC